MYVKKKMVNPKENYLKHSLMSYMQCIAAGKRIKTYIQYHCSYHLGRKAKYEKMFGPVCNVCSHVISLTNSYQKAN